MPGEVGLEPVLGHGELVVAKGDGGFGYDPVFYVPSLDKTFAELTAEEKNAVSHRAAATAKLKAALVSY